MVEKYFLREIVFINYRFPSVPWRRLPCAGRGCATGGILSASVRGKTHWGFQNKKNKRNNKFLCQYVVRCRDPSELGLLTSATVCLRCGGGGGGGQV